MMRIIAVPLSLLLLVDELFVTETRIVLGRSPERHLFVSCGFFFSFRALWRMMQQIKRKLSHL